MAEPKNTLKKVARRVPGARAVRDTLRARKVGVGAAPATSSPPPPPPADPIAKAITAEFDFTLPKTSSILVLGDEVERVASELRIRGFSTITTTTDASALATFGDDQFRVVVATRGPDADFDRELLGHVARVASTVVLVQPQEQVTVSTSLLEQAGFTGRSEHPVEGAEKETISVLRRMEAQSTLHDFWRQPLPHGNTPQAYLGPVHRSRALHRLIKDLDGDSKILEVGCNVGRNIAYLHDNGYPEVAGIEISPHAVKMLREKYPQLEGREVHIGPAGDILPGFEDDSFDLIYTMAVIEHLHPVEAAPVFDAMVRVAPNILAIEPENRLSHRQYPHDIVKEFTDRGMVHVSTTPMVEAITDHYEAAMEDYQAYRFVRADRAGAGNATDGAAASA
ncbi:class I SAM-dependent methyltransferase [Barrientosiimonas humi]|uniref:class I SAM-dependent methyltransferase n=1 Tax=Barrientosiimonas humi TaxID=999931 RepID=UPI00370DB1B6